MGRPRLHPNQAEKQFAYRKRTNEKQFEERQLAQRVKGLLEVATARGFVLDALAPTWAQLDELAEWLKSH